MMGKSDEIILPQHICNKTLANQFRTFFFDKIVNIRNGLGLPDEEICDEFVFSGTTYLETFAEATQTEISEIIKKAPSKSCELDPIPTWLLKECCTELVPIITSVINMSLNEGKVPTCMKTALIRPLLKKNGLEKDILKNYRLVSSLTFI